MQAGMRIWSNRGGNEIMSEVKNILLVGVGGQGTILASKILTSGLMKAGYDVKMSEIHGMSQRGGSVSTQVRFGDKVLSPIVGKGSADVIVAFEKMEALRWLDHLKIGGKMVINDHEILPVPVNLGMADYPEGIIEELKGICDVQSFKAADIATELGNAKAMNVVLLGALVKALGGLDNIDWDAEIEANVKPQFADLNKKAFHAGYNL